MSNLKIADKAIAERMKELIADKRFRRKLEKRVNIKGEQLTAYISSQVMLLKEKAGMKIEVRADTR